MSSLINFSAIMRKLTVQPNLITNKGYLEHSIKYAIDCEGSRSMDTWSSSFFPP